MQYNKCVCLVHRIIQHLFSIRDTDAHSQFDIYILTTKKPDNETAWFRNNPQIYIKKNNNVNRWLISARRKNTAMCLIQYKSLYIAIVFSYGES